jgi:transposase
MYAADQYEQGGGHNVARLPSYQCNLNGIETVWSQLKGYVARHNRNFKFSKTPAGRSRARGDYF